MDKKKALIAGIAALVLIGGGGAYLAFNNNNNKNEISHEKNSEDNTEGSSLKEESQNRKGTDKPEIPNENEEDQSSEGHFTCIVKGEEVSYLSNINIDSPLADESRISGVSETGTNVKLSLTNTAPGAYNENDFFGITYQPKMNGEYDQSKVYTSAYPDGRKQHGYKGISVTVNSFGENSGDLIDIDFSGFVYNGNNQELQLKDCSMSFERD
jgi:hypothetical protein